MCAYISTGTVSALHTRLQRYSLTMRHTYLTKCSQLPSKCCSLSASSIQWGKVDCLRKRSCEFPTSTKHRFGYFVSLLAVFAWAADVMLCMGTRLIWFGFATCTFDLVVLGNVLESNSQQRGCQIYQLLSLLVLKDLIMGVLVCPDQVQ